MVAAIESRRYHVAVGILAEMAMVSDRRFHDRKFVVFYDELKDEWVVQRQWRSREGLHSQHVLARAPDFPDAVAAAEAKWLAEGQS